MVAGKYELVRLIGKGAMGEVWLATHGSLGGQFAIKLVQPRDDQEDASAAGRFQLETQISAKLSRKTRPIVSVSDHGEEEGLAYLVMVLGTPSYMSTEQARGLETLDHRCDLWALAVLTFFERSFTPSLDARYRSASELSDALEALVDPDEVEAATGPAPRRAGAASRRRLATSHPSEPRGPAVAAMSVRGEVLGSHPGGGAVGGATVLVRRPARRPSAWRVAAIGAGVTTGAVVFALRAFTSRGAATGATPATTVITTERAREPTADPAEQTARPTQRR